MNVTNVLDLSGTTPAKAVKDANKAIKAGHTFGSEELEPDERISFEALMEEPEVELLTEQYVRDVYPVKLPPSTIKTVTEAINECIHGFDGSAQEFLKENIVGMIDVFKDNKSRWSMKDYLNAARFITYRQMGNTVLKAYTKTFPDKVMRMEREGTPNSHLMAYASTYNRSMLVQKMYAMIMMPAHILYQDTFHQAVATQTEIMLDDKVSPKVRSDAANSLMTHLKSPEVKQAELTISTKDNGAISQLADALNSLSGNQRERILEGKYSIKDISEATIYEEGSDVRD